MQSPHIMVLLYWLLTACCCTYAIAVGGQHGLIGGVIVLLQTVLGFGTIFIDESWVGTMYPLFLIDCAGLVVFMWLAIISDRFWPIWAAAYSLVSVLIHVATIWQPDVTPKIYQLMQQFWAIPMQISMLGGIMIDRKSGWVPSQNHEAH